jgi:hypothetical protein
MKWFLLCVMSITVTACTVFQFENISDVNRESIRKTFTENRADIQNCYITHPSQPNTVGKLIFDFELDDKGRVINASTSVEKSTLLNPELGQCICQKMKAWNFPKSASTETTRVLYPIYFSKDDSAIK